MSRITVPLLVKYLLETGILLYIENIIGVLNFIGYMIVMILRRYSSTMGLSTNLNVGCKSYYRMRLSSYIDQENDKES